MTEIEQHHFDHLLPRKPMLRVRDVVLSLGLSESTVEKLADCGQLPYLRVNGGTGQRTTRLMPRDGVILFLLKARTYEPADFLASIVGLLRKRSLPELCSIQAELGSLISKAKEASKPVASLALPHPARKRT